MSTDPVLKSQHDMLQAVIEFLCFVVAVDCSLVTDLIQDATPSEGESDGNVLTKMLYGPDAMDEPIFLLLSLELFPFLST